MSVTFSASAKYSLFTFGVRDSWGLKTLKTNAVSALQLLSWTLRGLARRSNIYWQKKAAAASWSWAQPEWEGKNSVPNTENTSSWAPREPTFHHYSPRQGGEGSPGYLRAGAPSSRRGHTHPRRGRAAAPRPGRRGAATNLYRWWNSPSSRQNTPGSGPARPSRRWSPAGEPASGCPRGTWWPGWVPAGLLRHGRGWRPEAAGGAAPRVSAAPGAASTPSWSTFGAWKGSGRRLRETAAVPARPGGGAVRGGPGPPAALLLLLLLWGFLLTYPPALLLPALLLQPSCLPTHLPSSSLAFFSLPAILLSPSCLFSCLSSFSLSSPFLPPSSCLPFSCPPPSACPAGLPGYFRSSCSKGSSWASKAKPPSEALGGQANNGFTHSQTFPPSEPCSWKLM